MKIIPDFLCHCRNKLKFNVLHNRFSRLLEDQDLKVRGAIYNLFSQLCIPKKHKYV